MVALGTALLDYDAAAGDEPPRRVIGRLMYDRFTVVAQLRVTLAEFGTRAAWLRTF
jgi:hypothetical protein